MSAGLPVESWEQWASRIAADLADLTDGEWLTLTPATSGSSGANWRADRGASASAHTSATGTTGGTAQNAAGKPARGRRWSLRRGSSSAPNAGRGPVADVFLQARRLGEVLALECISDTEFEGLSDLSPDQEQALVALGWEQDGHAPAFLRTFTMGGDAGAADVGAAASPAESPGPAESATLAAHLLRDSLDRVLGATSPDDVVLRRSVRET
jgi:hypothetical protein